MLIAITVLPGLRLAEHTSEELEVRLSLSAFNYVPAKQYHLQTCKVTLLHNYRQIATDSLKCAEPRVSVQHRYTSFAEKDAVN